MDWVAHNGLTLLLTLVFLFLVLRGPILGRVHGIVNISVHDLSTRLKENASLLLLDVRTPMEFNGGHIAGSRNAPLSELSGHVEALKGLGAQKDVVVVCRSGARSLHGAVLLKRAGFANVYNLSGGMVQWVAQRFPVRQFK